MHIRLLCYLMFIALVYHKLINTSLCNFTVCIYIYICVCVCVFLSFEAFFFDSKRKITIKGVLMLFHFLNFSQCVVCMFGHKKIYKVTNLKVHSKGRYLVKKKNPFSRTTTNGSFGLQSCFPVFVTSQK